MREEDRLEGFIVMAEYLTKVVLVTTLLAAVL
jgi:hypothetical protein